MPEGLIFLAIIVLMAWGFWIQDQHIRDLRQDIKNIQANADRLEKNMLASIDQDIEFLKKLKEIK